MDFIVDEIIERLYPRVKIVFRGTRLDDNGEPYLYACQFFMDNMLITISLPPHLGVFVNSLTNDEKLDCIETMIQHQVVEQVDCIIRGRPV